MKILIAAGGTGGHLFPAQSLAEELQNEGHEVLFAGCGLKNSTYFTNFSYVEISSGSIHPKKIFFSLGKILYGLFKAIRFLRKKKIDVIAGFGSFHTFPVMLAAKVVKRPIVLFEANLRLGKVNRFFAKKAVIGMQFPSHVKNSRLVMPLPWKRSSPSEKIFSGPGLTFLIFGGSQGAVFLNHLFLRTLHEIKKELAFRVIHLTGKNTSFKEVQKVYEREEIPCHVKSFASDMPSIYASTDIAICRAGASTISELIYYQIPAFLIPYPYASEHHQSDNARFFTEIVKGGVYTEQNELNQAEFVSAIKNLVQKKQEFRKNIEIYQKVKTSTVHFSELVLEAGRKR